MRVDLLAGYFYRMSRGNNTHACVGGSSAHFFGLRETGKVTGNISGIHVVVLRERLREMRVVLFAWNAACDSRASGRQKYDTSYIHTSKA